jgi:hypothetical protein
MSSFLAKVPEGRWRLAGDEVAGTRFIGVRFRRLHRWLTRSASPALLILLISLLAPLSTQATDFGDIGVTIETITDGGKSAHYDEYRAIITNRAPTKTHQVTLLLGGEFDRYSDNIVREIRRSFEIAPAATINVSLFAPPLALERGEIFVIIDGQRQREAVIIDTARTSAWTRHARDNAELLISASVGKSGLMNHEAVLSGFNSTETGASDVAYLSYNAPLAEWSEHWLAYAQFNAVLLTADELRTAPEAVRTALLRYVECGGALMVFGDWPVPAQWQARRELPTEGGTTNEQSPRAMPKNPPDMARYFMGFGELIVTSALADSTQITATSWQRLKQSWLQRRIKQTEYYNLADINDAFPVVARVGVPVRGLFMLMLLFVIVIGPVNLLWLARRRRKIWMLWTVPLLSLLTCLGVAGFAFFSEGLSATVRTESFTILDETAHRATTIGWTAFYAPITPSDGLHFSYDTELLPQLVSYRSYGGSNRVLDWTNDQHLVTDWVTARVPAYFKLRKSELRRERLSLREEPNGARSIVNGLGAEIEKLWWADGDGKIYTASKVAAGAAMNLEATRLQAAGGADYLRGMLGADWLTLWQEVERQPEQWLISNSYLALLNAAPFVEAGLKDVETRRARALVYGMPPDATPPGAAAR